MVFLVVDPIFPGFSGIPSLVYSPLLRVALDIVFTRWFLFLSSLVGVVVVLFNIVLEGFGAT